MAAYDVAYRHSAAGRVPPDAVALVNGVPISRTDYDRTLAAVEADRRTGRPEEADRRRVVNRLIEEELLLQRALDLGLVRANQRARKALTSAVIESVVSEGEHAAAGDPSEAELRRHYDDHRSYFATPARFRVRQIFFSGSGAAERAVDVRHRWASGVPFADLRTEGDRITVALPDALLPLSKLLDYLGPTAARSVTELRPGEVSEPIRSGQGVRLLRLVDRVEAETRPFEEVIEEVRADYRRRAGDRRLRTYLDALRADATIVVGDLTQ